MPRNWRLHGTGGATGTGGSPAPAGGPAGGKLIRNDVFWKDTAGTPIYSQGGGVLRLGGTYYWYGVKYGGAVTYAAKPTTLNSDTSFAGVTVYSSKDLATWKLENDVLIAVSLAQRRSALVRSDGRRLQRQDQEVRDGRADRGRRAVCSSPPATRRPATTRSTLRGHQLSSNGATGDQTVFQDDDGKAY